MGPKFRAFCYKSIFWKKKRRRQNFVFYVTNKYPFLKLGLIINLVGFIFFLQICVKNVAATMSEVSSDFVNLWIEVSDMSTGCVIVSWSNWPSSIKITIGSENIPVPPCLKSQVVSSNYESKSQKCPSDALLTYLHKIYNRLREYFYCHSYDMQLNFWITQSVQKSELPKSLILKRTLSKYG